MAPRSALLLLLISLACTAAAARRDYARASKCPKLPAEQPSAPGGWSATSHVPRSVRAPILAKLRADKLFTCKAARVSMAVHRACSQVVNGQNFQVVATLRCSQPAARVKVEATVYVPGSWNANTKPQLMSLAVRK